jgi:protein AATF/BFR2
MFKVAETSVLLKYPGDDLEEGKEMASDELWTKLERNFDATMPFVEQTIDRWNSQTQVLGNLKKNAKSHFNQTIVAQVNSMLSQTDQHKRIIDKTQLKREVYRVLGHGPEDFHQERDSNIYNDQDFYQVLLGDFLQQNEDDGSEEENLDPEQQERERHYLGNADLGLTRKAMARKAAIKVQPKKDVDRKASKNRKIKYVVHDKILNFMPARENLQKMEGKTAIVGNLFGRRLLAKADDKKRTETDDGVRLI